MELVKTTIYNSFNNNPYKEIKDSIFICEIRISDLEKDLKRIITLSGPKDVQAQQYDKGISSGKVESINDFFGLIIEKQEELKKLKTELSNLKRKKKMIEEQFMITLNDLEKKVFKYRNSDKAIFDIAYSLNRSERHIKRISADIYRKMNNWLLNLPKNEYIL